MLVTRVEIVAIAKHATHVTNGKANDMEFINDEEEEAPRPPRIPVPTLFIGNSKLRNVVSTVANMKDSSWFVHIVHYQPFVCIGFKKSDVDSLPHVTLSLSYPRASDEGDLFRGFKKFIEIQKPLDWSLVPCVPNWHCQLE